MLQSHLCFIIILSVKMSQFHQISMVLKCLPNVHIRIRIFVISTFEGENKQREAETQEEFLLILWKVPTNQQFVPTNQYLKQLRMLFILWFLGYMCVPSPLLIFTKTMMIAVFFRRLPQIIAVTFYFCCLSRILIHEQL